MSTRLPNPQRAKLHRSYSVEEVARVCGVHRNTVRHWIKAGLRTCDDRRPVLILGHDLRFYLQAKRTRNKRPCAPWQIYCVRCRTPQVPAGNMADYRPGSRSGGMLEAICPICGSMMYRRISPAQLPEMRSVLEITLPCADSRIGARAHPCVNSDF